MTPFARDVVPIRIEDEMKNSYMDYSMSVIIGRALPDVRDGLKPVHRRVLYAMYREGLLSSRKYSKCAGVVGEVLKKYHPHGDASVYDALVRMAQPWNLRYLLVDGQGNFGSVDGDPAAAYRYTECKMTRLAEELLTDIDKETVSFSPNFDGTTEEPDVLPSRFPNLLVNGADGIAVGMATKIPPHNLREIVNACLAVIETPEIDVDGLLALVPGPDFPTAGMIYGRKGVRDAYETGRGRITLRGRADFEELQGGRRAIVIDQIPYQVNKSRLIEQIAELVKERRLDGISALRDESDREGMRIVIELKHAAIGEVVLNGLYKHTQLQTTFGVILLSIVNQQPRVLTLKEMLQLYIAHRREVILRRTRFELREARARAHILEGFARALDMLDAVIALIRGSTTPGIAREGLVETLGFTPIQADAILELRLQRLTGMERQKILDELAAIHARIAELEAILASEELLMGVVKSELVEVRDAYSDERRTKILDARGEISLTDLIAEEDQVVTLSHLGYIKRCKPSEWRMQRRGGVGKQGMTTRDEDFVTSLFIANTHSLLLVFTARGKVFPLQVYDVPEAGRGARGRPIVNLVQVPDGDRVAAVVSVRNLDEVADKWLLFVSRLGRVKRMPLEAYQNLRQGGLIAVGINDGDELVYVLTADGLKHHVMMFTRKGKCIRFELPQVPEKKGRSARGVRGIKVGAADEVVDALLFPAEDVEITVVPPAEEGEEVEEVDAAADDEPDEADEADEAASDEEDVEEPDETTLLTATELGFGKRVRFPRYRTQGRNGKGIISHKTSSSSGDVVGAIEVSHDDNVMLATNTGRVIRIQAGEVRLVTGRSSKGVRLMKLEPGERIVDLARLDEEAVVAPADAAEAQEPDADVAVATPDGSDVDA
jgi:DNA gyrase subunit A